MTEQPAKPVYPAIQFSEPQFRPRLDQITVLVMDRLGHADNFLFGMKQIHDLNGIGNQLITGVPDPQCVITDHHLPFCLMKLASIRFTIHSLAEC